MKGFLVGLVLLVVLGFAGYYWVTNVGSSTKKTTPSMTASITRTGVLQKSAAKNVDFTHTIVSGGQSWGVASYSVKLDEYVGKTVRATGQNSGTTLFVDTIAIVSE